MLSRILQAISSAVPSVVSAGAYCQMSRLISSFRSLYWSRPDGEQGAALNAASVGSVCALGASMSFGVFIVVVSRVSELGR